MRKGVFGLYTTYKDSEQFVHRSEQYVQAFAGFSSIFVLHAIIVLDNMDCMDVQAGRLVSSHLSRNEKTPNAQLFVTIER